MLIGELPEPGIVREVRGDAERNLSAPSTFITVRWRARLHAGPESVVAHQLTVTSCCSSHLCWRQVAQAEDARRGLVDADLHTGPRALAAARIAGDAAHGGATLGEIIAVAELRSPWCYHLCCVRDRIDC